MTRRFALVVAFGVVVCTAGGCASKGNVTGKVTHQGKPVTSGTVTMIASDKMPYPGMINADGSYSIANVPSGPVKVLVTSPRPAGENRVAPPIGGGDTDISKGPDPAAVQAAPDGWFPIPDKYGDPTTTTLTGTVRSPMVTIDLTLE